MVAKVLTRVKINSRLSPDLGYFQETCPDLPAVHCCFQIEERERRNPGIFSFFLSFNH